MKNVILIVIAIAALGGAVVIAGNYFANRESPASGLVADEEHWQCQDCDHFFTMTKKETLAMLKSGQSAPTCPECGSDFVLRVFKCPYCGEPVPPSGHGDVPEECPHCGHYLEPNLGG